MPTCSNEIAQHIHILFSIPVGLVSNALVSCCFLGLLYQEYRDKSTRQEIETRRLQDSQRDPEERLASEETPSETEATNTVESKAVPQISLLRNTTSRFNLWQDLPEVRSSGVLNILQPDEIKLQEVIAGTRERWKKLAL